MGKITMAEKKDNVEVETIKPDSILTVKKEEIPNLPDGTLYYGNKIGKYTEVMMHRKRDRAHNIASGVQSYSQIYGYIEPKIFDDGYAKNIMYNIMPPPKRAFEGFLYPVAIWNITLTLLDGISHIPFWKRQQVINPNNNMPITIGTKMIYSYYFVIVNDTYQPKQLPNGNTDDGNWIISDPATAEYINKKLEELENRAVKKLEYPTR